MRKGWSVGDPTSMQGYTQIHCPDQNVLEGNRLEGILFNCLSSHGGWPNLLVVIQVRFLAEAGIFPQLFAQNYL
jgi:hypothetical protein